MLIKNFSYSILFKLLGMLISLVLVPLLINLLGVKQYGVWVTFTSLLTWMSLFDFGLGYALKNTVTKSLANNSLFIAQSELFQVLKVTTIISFLLLIIFFISLATIELLYKHLYLSIVLLVPFIILFPLKVGTPILQGARKIALESGLLFINPIVFFLSVLTINELNIKIKLIDLAILFVASYAISTYLLWIFSIKAIKLSHINLKEVFYHKIDFIRIRTGIKFFGLQVSSMALYSIGTILVFSSLDATHAAYFDVLNKIFIFGLTIFNIGITVFWPEITHNIENNNFLRIKKLYFSMIILSAIFSVCSIVFSYIVPQVIDLWTDGKIHIEQHEAIYFSFLVSVQSFAYSGAVILNAFEKINYQLILAFVSTIIMLPLSLYFIKIGYSISSIPLSAGILTSITSIYCNIHAVRLINGGLINAKKNT